jgi:hypothetical protein
MVFAGWKASGTGCLFLGEGGVGLLRREMGHGLAPSMVDFPKRDHWSKRRGQGRNPETWTVENKPEVRMPWEVEYKREKEMVVVTATGHVSGQDGKDQAEKAVRLLQEKRTTLVLVDYSEAMSEVSLPNLYLLPEHFAALGAPWHARIAVLLPRTGYRMESYQFFELACKRAGYSVKLFAETGPAEDWLRQGRPAGETGRTSKP